MYWIRVFCQKMDILRATQCDSVPESPFVQKKKLKQLGSRNVINVKIRLMVIQTVSKVISGNYNIFNSHNSP